MFLKQEAWFYGERKQGRDPEMKIADWGLIPL